MSGSMTLELRDAEIGEWVEVAAGLTCELFIAGKAVDVATLVRDLVGASQKGVAAHSQGAFHSRQLSRKFSRATRDGRLADIRLVIGGVGAISGKFYRGALDFHGNEDDPEAFHVVLNSSGRLSHQA